MQGAMSDSSSIFLIDLETSQAGIFDRWIERMSEGQKDHMFHMFLAQGSLL